MNHVQLLGSEEVARAGRQIEAAAENLKQAAGLIDEALVRHQRFLDEWMCRFEAVVEQFKGDK